MTFYYHDLPLPIKSDLHNNHYYYYSIPTALVIALVFLNYLAMSFGTQSRLRREALSKINLTGLILTAFAIVKVWYYKKLKFEILIAISLILFIMIMLTLQVYL